MLQPYGCSTTLTQPSCFFWNMAVPPAVLRAAAAATFHARLQPTDPGWVDLVPAIPLLDAGRARRELGWNPRFAATDAVGEILDGFRNHAGMATAPLTPVG